MQLFAPKTWVYKDIENILNGYTDDEGLVHLLGGDLKIEYDRESNHIFMTGPATTVFEGEIEG